MKNFFTVLIKKFRISIFAEYAPMLLVVVAFFAIILFIPNQDSPIKSEQDFSQAENNRLSPEALAEAIKIMESEQPARITGNETLEEIYNNPYVKHIRTALNAYLDGSNIGAEEVIAMEEVDNSDDCGLDIVDKSYYESRFFIYDISDNDYGGVQAHIVFVDNPDTIFWAWVYKLGGDGEYSLRGFCKAGPPDEKKEVFLQITKDYIESGEMKFSL